MSGGRVCPRQLKKIELHAVRIGDNLLKMRKNVDVLFDARMTKEYVARDSGGQFCYCQPMEYNARIRRYATHGPTEQIVNAFVTSKLDIANALFHRLPRKQIQRLQRVQNGRPARWKATRNSAKQHHFSSSCTGCRQQDE